jgi:hypothetical protein
VHAVGAIGSSARHAGMDLYGRCGAIGIEAGQDAIVEGVDEMRRQSRKD